MSAPEPHPGFPIDDPATLRARMDALASRMVDVGRASLGRDPVVMALVDHQRHKPDKCLCGWGDLGKSHAEHVAGIVRPLIEAEVREAAAREIGARIADMEAERADKLQGYELHQRDGALEALRDVLTSLRGGDQW